MNNNIKFLDSLNILIDNIRNNNKVSNILLFFLKTILIIIFIKIPFIYVRDMIDTIFYNNIKDYYYIWYFIIEITYAITCIILLVNRIKKKALEFKN